MFSFFLSLSLSISLSLWYVLSCQHLSLPFPPSSLSVRFPGSWKFQTLVFRKVCFGFSKLSCCFLYGFTCFILCFRVLWGCVRRRQCHVWSMSHCCWFQVQSDIGEGTTHHFSTHSCSRWPLRATTHQRSMNFFFSRDYVSFSVSWKLGLVHSPSSSNFKRMCCQGFKIGCTLRTFPGSNISSQFHHSTGLPVAQTHACDGLCYIRRVSQMSSQTCRDSGLFLCFHTHTAYITLLDAVDGVFGLFDLNRQSKSNKLGDVLTFLHFVPQVSNLSALLSFNNVISVLHLGPADHEAARKDFPILAELQQSNNNVKALVWFCKLIEAFFADPFTASPIVDEEEGFAENPIQLASVLLLFLRSRKPKHSEATMTRFCDFLYLSVTWYVAWLQALDRPYWKHFMTAFGSKHLNVRSYRFTWWLGILIARGAVNQLFCK